MHLNGARKDKRRIILIICILVIWGNISDCYGSDRIMHFVKEIGGKTEPEIIANLEENTTSGIYTNEGQFCNYILVIENKGNRPVHLNYFTEQYIITDKEGNKYEPKIDIGYYPKAINPKEVKKIFFYINIYKTQIAEVIFTLEHKKRIFVLTKE